MALKNAPNLEAARVPLVLGLELAYSNKVSPEERHITTSDSHPLFVLPCLGMHPDTAPHIRDEKNMNCRALEVWLVT